MYKTLINRSKKLSGEVFEERTCLSASVFLPNKIASNGASFPAVVRTTDLNSDGWQDVVFLSFEPLSRRLAYAYGGEDGFGEARTLPAQSFEVIDLVDIDGDGDDDIVGQQPTNQFSWYENVDGQYDTDAIPLFQSERSANSIVGSDIDADGDNDIVVAGNGQVSWYENLDGEGLFSSGIRLNAAVHLGGSTLFALDVDDDNDVDVVVGFGQSLAWYENVGEGVFEENLLVTDHPGRVIATMIDLDQDGNVDIAMRSVNQIVGFRNEGGRFTQRSVSISNLSMVESALSLHAVDIDGDAIEDLTMTVYDSKSVWFRSNGDGSFDDEQVLVDGAIVDANFVELDGQPGIDIVGGLRTSVSWIASIRNGESFSAPIAVASSPTVGARSISIGDISGDGVADLAIASHHIPKPSNISWFEQSEAVREFHKPVVIDDEYGTQQIELGDIDGDGDLDFFGWQWEYEGVRGDLFWHENNNGVAGPRQAILEEVFGFEGEVALDDINGDGALDVLVAPNGFPARWLEYDKANNIFLERTLFSDFAASRIMSGDIDGDGDKDIITADWQIVWYPNLDGLGTFGGAVEVGDPGISDVSIDIGDVDGDDDVDVVAHMRQELVWFENTDTLGAFTQSHQVMRYGNRPRETDVALGDMDGDGDFDIVVGRDDGSAGESVVVFENNAGEFDSAFTVTTELRGFGDLEIYDLDADGDKDVVVVSREDGQVTWYENRVVGDANNDGQFGSSDLVAVFVSGEYEDGIIGNSSFAEGDWNGDGDFDSSDLVFAFESGGYSVASVAMQTELFAAAIDEARDKKTESPQRKRFRR